MCARHDEPIGLATPRDSVPRSLAIFTIYLGVVAWITWPLVTGLGSLLPDHHDAYLNTWIIASNVRRLAEAPLQLFHGHALYPLGNVLALSELLLVPALVGAPVLFISGNPILTYNVVLVSFWAFSAWAMYHVASRLTGYRLAGWVAGFVYTTFPYRMEYHVDIQMQMAFGFPLGLWCFYRFLAFQTWGSLGWTLLVVVLQTLSSWYYGILLSLLLAAFAVAYAMLRWRGWSPGLVPKLAVGALGLALVVGPFTWPYFEMRAELGEERTLADLKRGSSRADVLTYLASNSRLSRFLLKPFHPRSYAEVDLFPGVAVVGLAGVGWWALRERRRQEGPAGLDSAFLVTGLLVSAAFLLVAGHGRHLSAGALRITLPTAKALLVALLLLLLARLVIAGGQAWRRAAAARVLAEGEWGLVLSWLAVVFFIFSLGTSIRYGGRSIEGGLYLYLYEWLLPLHAIRLVVRYGIVVLFVLALLAGFGVAAGARWAGPGPWRRRALVAGVLALVSLEPATTASVPYKIMPWTAPPPVYEILRRTPGDFAVLEWPMFWGVADSMLWALYHGKRIVNGWSGVRPDLEAEISGAISAEGQDPFPSPDVYRLLRKIFPLRYIVVHPARLSFPDRARWAELQSGRDSRLRFVGHFERHDLYEIPPLPERGRRLERWVSYDFLRAHRVAQVRLQPLTTGPHIEQWVNVLLNDEGVARISLDRRADAITVVSLVSPLRHTLPNVIALSYGYRRPPAALDARYRIGSTRTLSPADLLARSGGQPYGDLASIQVDGVERARGQRGYNLVALDPDGRLLGAEVFDTFHDPQAARDLAAWIAPLRTGTIVAGAVKDEGSRWLTEDAVRALATLGVRGDLRGRFRESHAFVGVKGEPAGSALEALGPTGVELVVGRVEAGLGFELTEFRAMPR